MVLEKLQNKWGNNSPHAKSVFDSYVTAFSNAFPILRFSFYGEVFSAGKQPLAPFELIFALFYGMLSIFQWSGEGFTISVRLLYSFKRRYFLYVNSSTRKNRLKPLFNRGIHKNYLSYIR